MHNRLKQSLLAYAVGTLVGATFIGLLREAMSFLYIGMVDLAPILHHDSGFKSSVVQLAGLLTGVGTILLLHNALG
ncbi:MAG TPA: hypothetical protein VFY67_11910 [Pyrinomonadaceae bacterium]|nr:hypothetical protein [Pyrinomonadaceae bacterium]